MEPTTRYAKSGDVSIAYQVIGDGPIDLLIVPGFVSHLEQAWEDPAYARFMRHLSSFSRLIMFDKRGTGLSDRIGNIPTLEERVDDVRAVLDAAKSERAALLGISEGGPMSILFAASYPHRTIALILYGSIAKGSWAADYPWGSKPGDQREAWLKGWRENWGGPYSLESWAPSATHDERFRRWWAKYLRLGASPAAVINLFRMNMEIDVRALLSSIHVPTMVLHRSGDKAVSVEEGRYLAQHIKGAKFVELQGEDHLWWVGDADAIVSAIADFLTGKRHRRETDRALVTVMFTDIVNSTGLAERLGDSQWRELLLAHNEATKEEVSQFNGRFIKSTGDGALLTFDGPGRAIRCAIELIGRVQQLGLSIRCGLHTGEVELIDGDISGIAVHVAARVIDHAGPNSVWASRVIKDLVVGSGIKFKEAGVFKLKGIEGSWPLFAIEC